MLSGVSSDQQSVAVLTRRRRLADAAGTSARSRSCRRAAARRLTLDVRSNGGAVQPRHDAVVPAAASASSARRYAATPPSVAHVYGAPATSGRRRWARRSRSATTCATTPVAGRQRLRCSSTGRRSPSTPPTRHALRGRRFVVRGRRVQRSARARRHRGAGRVAPLERRRARRSRPCAARPRPTRARCCSSSPSTARLQLLSSGVNARSAMMTPDGATLAWVEGANEVHTLQPATATSLLTPIVADRRRRDDGRRRRLRRQDARSSPPGRRRWRWLSASGTTPLPVDEAAAVLRLASGAGHDRSLRLVFARHHRRQRRSPICGCSICVTPGAQPVQLAVAVDNADRQRASPSPTTASSVQFFDNFDPVTRRGDEYVVPLADADAHAGRRRRAQRRLPSRATTRLLYINAPDADERRRRAYDAVVTDRAAAVQSVGIGQLRRLAPASGAHLVHAGDRRRRRRRLVHAAALIEGAER